ncbi:hypothetical protein NDU88_001262 [Pleurodeles waltl]|uniref:Uncharacterized protein n=1 Tax=Pleurodeles waltl TaxID=8319 RepID=A0AAV7NCW6_PLEWA|nr:hypothetical protein NDU88_001262 [Pleurodeles waltl]
MNSDDRNSVIHKHCYGNSIPRAGLFRAYLTLDGSRCEVPCHSGARAGEPLPRVVNQLALVYSVPRAHREAWTTRRDVAVTKATNVETFHIAGIRATIPKERNKRFTLPK